MAIKVGNRTFADAEQLEKLVVHAATEYELTGYVEDFDGVEISDPEYDELIKALKLHKPTSKALKGTSPSAAQPKGKTVKHSPPMTSINKADGEEDEKKEILKKWVADCAKRLGKPIIDLALVMELKHDGVAVRLKYKNGVLVSAGLRPRDGVNGTDVTEHVKHVKGVFTKLSLPLTLDLNGEIECWLSDFEEVNKEQDAKGEEPYKNPRNYTAGVMGRDDPDEVKGARLRISYHSIVNFDEWQNHYRTVTERAKWANTKLGLRDEDGNGFFVRSEPFKFSELARLEKLSKELQYYTDGVVLKVDDLEDYEELGHIGDDHLNPPRGALAWKFAEEVANATVKELEWNASRTGRVVPTAILTKPVRLADTDVTRATVNNYGWASKMGIGAGTVVQVKKAGKIIPNVCGVVSSQVTDIGAPENCPTCGTKLKLLTSGNGNIDLTCENKECGAKQIQSWLFFIQKVGGKGLGTSQMEKILATGKVKRLHNLFDLNVRDLVDAGFSERQAALALGTIFGLLHEKDNDKLLKQIEQARSQKRQIEAWKFFSALGIPGAGETVGKALIQHYKDFDAIRDASVDDLLSVPGIGQTTAQAIYDWFAEHNDMVDQLFLRFELELPKTGKLTGKNFVLTGSFTFGKKYWQERIEDQGGNIQSSVGKTTHYLIQEHGKNDGSPSDKEQKAAKLGIPVISVVDLEKMLSTTLAAKDSGSCHSNFKQPLTVF